MYGDKSVHYSLFGSCSWSCCLIIKTESLIVNTCIVVLYKLSCEPYCVSEYQLYWKTLFTGQAIPKRERIVTQRLLTLKEELLVTLVHLQRGLEVDIVSDNMGISSALVSRIVTTWIHLLSWELKFLIKWPTRQQVASTLPRAFRFFSKTRVIIDCTELQLQKPSLPSVQRKSYSTYTNTETLLNVWLESPHVVHSVLYLICGLGQYLTGRLWKNMGFWTWLRKGMM